ncbi:hypothetical protein C2E21_6426 [Chlorella sorokiniana]|uniref:SGNH hydrolase-type esterase domain-containing protein n=1 Tax=Chlorella sorokiniana TaxID=3076 RepID=A0A2P6TLU8_CHLSO|nr:hypothetical protein C2E21_6426 [Chlorella sorokiniana]|eukprot:PRW45267.1 hypothetical protein C2E21_6426 [Chlorella sorokiniana]
MASEFITALRGKQEEQQRRGGSPRASLLSPATIYLLIGALLVGAVITMSPALVHRREDFQAITKLLPCVGEPAAAAAEQQAAAQPAPLIAQPPPLRTLSFPPEWQPLLTREERLRGISYWGSGGRLQRVAQKLLTGQPVKVFTLGGSVTSGGGSSSSTKLGYVPRFFEFLQHNFPHKEHVLENKAIAASTAFMYAACLQHHVPEDADLVTLEFSVNEKPDAPYPSPERRAFEQLLRRLLRLPGRPAVLVLHHWGWWNALGDGIDRGLFYSQPEGQLTAFSNYYDLPTLSLRSAAYHLMDAGLPKFQIGRVGLPQQHLFFEKGKVRVGPIPLATPETKNEYFYADATHPGNSGHQVLAELMAGALMRAVWEVQVEGGAVSDADRRQPPVSQDLPRPMVPFSRDELPGVCAMQEEFKPIVKKAKGFEYLPERPDADGFMRQKWGWRGTKPGDWAELEVDTRASDGSPPANTYIWLSHLASYQGMGTALVECVSGCKCERSILDGTWGREASLFTVMRFHVTRSPACRIRVTVLSQPGRKKQKGHKVTLAAIMVTHVPLGEGATEGSLGLVQNIGLSHDRGWKDR